MATVDDTACLVAGLGLAVETRLDGVVMQGMIRLPCCAGFLSVPTPAISIHAWKRESSLNNGSKPGGARLLQQARCRETRRRNHRRCAALSRSVLCTAGLGVGAEANIQLPDVTRRFVVERLDCLVARGSARRPVTYL